MQSCAEQRSWKAEGPRRCAAWHRPRATVCPAGGWKARSSPDPQRQLLSAALRSSQPRCAPLSARGDFAAFVALLSTARKSQPATICSIPTALRHADQPPRFTLPKADLKQRELLFLEDPSYQNTSTPRRASPPAHKAVRLRCKKLRAELGRPPSQAVPRPGVTLRTGGDTSCTNHAHKTSPDPQSNTTALVWSHPPLKASATGQ